MSPTLSLLALASFASAATPADGDDWNPIGEEIFFLDEDYDDGTVYEDVVNGSQVTSQRWEATVGIIFGNSYVGCTGTLIHPKVVLTAAHCVGGISGVLIDAKDSSEMYQGGEIVRVIDQIAHPNYNNWGSDIAILRLDERVTSVEPAPVGIECIVDDYLKEGAKVEVVGYGGNRPDGNGYNSALNHGGTFIQTPDCSVSTVDGFASGCDPSVAPGGEVGAGGNEVDSCFGDSGGPLYLKTDEGDFVIGATSRSYWGVPSSTPCLYGGVYSRPDYFIDWIEEVADVNMQYDFSCNEAAELIVPTINVAAGESATVAASINDPDGPEDQVVLEITQQGLHGTASVDALGNITYSANSDAPAGETDSFTVSATDRGVNKYPRTGGPITADFDVDVNLAAATGLAALTSGCGCDSVSDSGAAGWLGMLGALALVRRRRD